MRLVDLNILLYAVNRDSAQHARAKAWLDRTLTDDRPVALPWVVLLGFLRVTTSARVFPEPLRPTEAMAVVDGWLARPPVIPLAPGEGHWSILRELLAESGTAGNLTTDAHLAALALEHGAELCSTDADFARFRRLRWVNPLAG
ncbi:MAG TPA: type II toxin-antitoxin system VapC family toxin [Gemmatimonadales bacterium]|nr:type II toxin-antitoxin system VapC family toxin [Gemmatimonadales bacterium]